MPINFLQHIKSSVSSKPKPVLGQEEACQALNGNVFEAYIFSCKDLKRPQPLFNDGLPSMILMPQKSDTVYLKGNNGTIICNAAWVCCGSIENIYWEVPEGLGDILVLRFKPSCFYSLFHVLPSVFHSKPIHNLEDVVGGQWMAVFDEMYGKNALSERISFLENVFSSLEANSYFPCLLGVAIDYIDEKKGNTTIPEVVNRLGKSVNTKWLQRNFVKYMGIAPKKYISLQRFIYTYGLCDKNNSAALVDVATLSGYYDYNHFLKDFKRYIGMAPSRYPWD